MALWWGAEVITAPTWRNLDSSFESWAYRSGFSSRLDYLEREQFLEKRPGADAAKWIYRLTEKGRLAGLGGRDPERCWDERWDGLWRMVVFDLPEREPGPRKRLWRWLRANRFGCLQNSLWIKPVLDVGLERQWSADHPDLQIFAVFEGRPRSGASDEEIVAGAWDFEEIDRNYGDYVAHLKEAPTRGQKTAPAPEVLRGWIRQENLLWRRAVRMDPLLPNQLLPKGYRGRAAWKRRREVWKRIGSRMRDCHPA